MPSTISRRKLLKKLATCYATSVLPIHSSLLQGKTNKILKNIKSYGPLNPVKDKTTGLYLLKLPNGFEYSSFNWSGEQMFDNTLTSGGNYGMAFINSNHKNQSILISNQVINIDFKNNQNIKIINGKTHFYDHSFTDNKLSENKPFNEMGGVTLLTVKKDKLIKSKFIQAGMMSNFSGGPTPWQTWLSAEDIMLRGEKIGTKDHGFIFEVTPKQWTYI